MNSPSRVLIVEDEEDIRESVAMWLGVAGYDTTQASDGVDGLESAVTSPPDAILLDMMMPRMNGLKAMEGLKATAATAEIPVVMLSASLRDEQRALDAGARFFIHKPYDHKKLLAALKSALA
ncbi:Response regulator MprA [Posidoniimonas polymericola]|uniref:Response regulator MprA n=1 Tax=Posidoniimonas polymericola TaxID=2528002 RepID=A0A5C5YFN1_9BACT|nr:response regulator [Posidoniimonas polymericola]TWT74517.1 Response regulator MprA [Posidoniimonas polymericola]